MADDGWMFAFGEPTRRKVGPKDGPTMVGEDRYPKVIRDQREVYGVATVDEVRRFWGEFLARQAAHGVGPGAPFRDEQARTVVPFVNRSRWMALCPECSGGMICWEENPDTCCVDCGRVFEVAHHTGFVRAEVSRLLAVRPTVNRNWEPEKETTERLAFENLIHGAGDRVVADGLVLPAGLELPDGVATHQEYLDRLATVHAKAQKAMA